MSTSHETISRRMASLLLQGYCLLADCCSNCQNLLMRSRDGQYLCVYCYTWPTIKSTVKRVKQYYSDDCNHIDEKQSMVNLDRPTKLLRLDGVGNKSFNCHAGSKIINPDNDDFESTSIYQIAQGLGESKLSDKLLKASSLDPVNCVSLWTSNPD